MLHVKPNPISHLRHHLLIGNESAIKHQVLMLS